jgi:hypothetical protein
MEDDSRVALESLVANERRNVVRNAGLFLTVVSAVTAFVGWRLGVFKQPLILSASLIFLPSSTIETFDKRLLQRRRGASFPLFPPVPPDAGWEPRAIQLSVGSPDTRSRARRDRGRAAGEAGSAARGGRADRESSRGRESAAPPDAAAPRRAGAGAMQPGANLRRGGARRSGTPVGSEPSSTHSVRCRVPTSPALSTVHSNRCADCIRRSRGRRPSRNLESNASGTSLAQSGIPGCKPTAGNGSARCQPPEWTPRGKRVASDS